MNSTPIIPLNEWIDHSECFIQPLQPGEYDITPIIRARYGNLLKDGIISIRLFAEYNYAALFVTESSNIEKVIIEFSNIQVKSQADSIQGLDDKFFRNVFL